MSCFSATTYESLETPAYLFDPEILMSNFRTLKEKLGTQLILSVKANPCPDLLLRTSHVITDGYEVASLKELNLVANQGKGTKYVNNPSMGLPLIRAAVASKSTLIIDNIHQVELLTKLTNVHSIKPLIIRLNASILKRFNADHPKIRHDHFGVDWDALPSLIARIHSLGIEVKGFHLFKGSHSFTSTALATLVSIKNAIPELERVLGYSLKYFNLGGGFGPEWQQSKFDFTGYNEALKTLPAYIELAHESGRGLVSTAGKFIVRVLSTKILNDQLIAICDGGIGQNFLLCKTESALRKYQPPLLLKISSNNSNAISQFPITYVGTSCSQDDIIARVPEGGQLPEAGDICLFDNCGAYCHTYTMPNFLGLGEANIYIGNC